MPAGREYSEGYSGLHICWGGLKRRAGDRSWHQNAGLTLFVKVYSVGMLCIVPARRGLWGRGRGCGRGSRDAIFGVVGLTGGAVKLADQSHVGHYRF